MIGSFFNKIEKTQRERWGLNHPHPANETERLLQGILEMCWNIFKILCLIFFVIALKLF